jgi:hypothetical protein
MSDTPRTDANVSITTKEGCETIAPDFARQLERELNDARAELAHWKANHDNQVKIKSTLIQRPDLGDRASKIQKLIEENAAMREALREAHTALSQLDECRIFCADSMDIDSYVTDDCATALAKLQPFLKP